MATTVPPPAWLEADPEALRRALAEAKADSELPGPGMFDYAVDLARALRDWIFGALERVPWAGLPTFERIALFTALGGSALAVVIVLWAVVRRWRKRRAARQTTAEVVPVPAAAEPPSGDASWWQRELQRRLAEGRLRAALEAAWWWTARRLDPPGLDSSWTTGDLLRKGGAAALRSPLRRLDRQLWGGGALRRDEVESVVAELGGTP